MDYATEAIDDYMKLDGDFSAFLKREDLAKAQQNYPQLWSLWNLTERVIRNDEAFSLRLEKLLRERAGE